MGHGGPDEVVALLTYLPAFGRDSAGDREGRRGQPGKGSRQAQRAHAGILASLDRHGLAPETGPLAGLLGG